MPGPIAKRIEERRRTNAVPGETVVVMHGSVVPPELPEGLHPLALEWYRSIAESGQSFYFEPTDWTAARYVAEAMSKNLNQDKRFSAQLFGTVWAAMADMLSTELSRRKAKLQVQRIVDGAGSDEGEKPTKIDEYKRKLGAK